MDARWQELFHKVLVSYMQWKSGDVSSPPGNPDDSDSIAATVNDESISDYELRQRVGLYIATSGIK